MDSREYPSLGGSGILIHAIILNVFKCRHFKRIEMRLRIKEMLEIYNEDHGHKMTMKKLAIMLYGDKGSIDATKINRISAINSGRVVANISETVKLCELLDCGCGDIIDED